ncbi:uncharacterized protein TRAVEDRAFT_29832 [Trametes versicolor FP-101664 SS1]|uniref:uncharacterized protein n=1 Tax=Trametes versicolor (strain FP-101664) TaxID=717944 RepID=UPI000462325C|nr:uncharacterized protein TRAVEDRAFT_29832 [Trametes versicolor FP-101664 SS1]EIW57950.1 hypothetical protein TRAVEDRAFT_29832 [Trametes versicolor FP-101664 SS1]
MSLIGRLDTTDPAAAAAPANPLAALPKLPAIDNTYGAMMIGTFLSLILYGFALLQAYNYTRLRFKDPTLVKVYVAVIMVMDTFQTILSMHICYWYLVTNYFDPTRLFSGIWSINLLGVSVGMTLVACQSFFARRVYIIGSLKYRILVMITGIMFIAELGFATAGTYYASVLPNFAEFHKVAWLNSASFSLAIAADLILTVVLIMVLRKSRTGFDHTDSLIDVLIMYSVCTGLITTVFSALSLIVAVALPNSLIYAGCDLVVSKLYVNSVLAALNYRDTVRNPTTSLRQGKAINLSTSVRTGTRGDVSMDWATTNHIRSTEFENSVIELKSTREMMDNIDEV